MNGTAWLKVTHALTGALEAKTGTPHDITDGVLCSTDVPFGWSP